jgi:hypothetical protein
MQEVVKQEDNRIEIMVWDELTESEFRQVIHQLESLCAENPRIDVMLDAARLKKVDFKAAIDEYDFYKHYRKHLERIAIVSDSQFASWLGAMFREFDNVDLKVFPAQEADEARKWIFPPRLP